MLLRELDMESNKEVTMREFSESDYSELLYTAITQINTAKNILATQINTTVNSVYWNLGKLLHEKRIENGYGKNSMNDMKLHLKKCNRALHFYRGIKIF